MSDSVWPHRRPPTRLPSPWDSQGKNTGVGCHFLLQCMKVKSESEVEQPCPTLSDPMDCSPPGSSVHGIFQAKYWSGVPLPSPFCNPGIDKFYFIVNQGRSRIYILTHPLPHRLDFRAYKGNFSGYSLLEDECPLHSLALFLLGKRSWATHCTPLREE